VIEQILQAHSGYLDAVVKARLVPCLLTDPDNLPEKWRRLRPHAGPLLKDAVKRDAHYYPWPYDEPVV
jgi:hypothetical protein